MISAFIRQTNAFQRYGALFPNFLCVFATCLLTQQGHADEVVLRVKTGGLVISGELLSFDGQTYQLQTNLGPMNVDALMVDCEGSACEAQPQQDRTILVNGEAGFVQKLLPAFAGGFAESVSGDVRVSESEARYAVADSAGVDIAVLEEKKGATSDFGDLLTQEVDMIVSRKSFDSGGIEVIDSDGKEARPLTFDQKVIGLDGVVIVTSKRNPIRAINEAALSEIFSGNVRNWDELGLPAAPINLYVSEMNDETSRLFSSLFLDANGLAFSDNLAVLASDEQVDQAVADDPAGLGLTRFSVINESKIINIAGSCGLQIPPNAFTIKTEEYPLTQRIFAYRANRENKALYNRMFDFIDSSEVQVRLDKTELVGLNVGYQTTDQQGLRYQSALLASDVDTNLKELRAMSRQLASADRMSTTFRFEFGSSRLDGRAESDVKRLASLLSTGDFKNKEVLLVGFTDAVGDAEANRKLSARRAEIVRSEIYAAAAEGSLNELDISAFGLGEMSPVNCNDSPRGQQANRRVEVWIRDIIRAVR